MTVLVVQEGLGKVVIFSTPDASDRTVVDVGEKPHEIELSPDGRTAYVSNFGLLEANYQIGTPGTTISVIDVAARVERTRYELPAGSTAPHGIKLRPPEYRELFSNAERGTEAMVVFDARSGAVRRSFPLPAGVHNFVFNADGSALFAFTMRGEVHRIDPEAGKTEARVRTGSPRGLAWTADGRHLIVSGRDELLLLDPERLAIERRIQPLGAGQIFYPAPTPDGRFLLAPAVLDGVTLVIEMASGSVTKRLATGSPLLAAMDPGGKRAWISNVLVPAAMLGPDGQGRDGGITLLDLATFDTTDVPGIVDANGIAAAWQV